MGLSLILSFFALQMAHAVSGETSLEPILIRSNAPARVGTFESTPLDSQPISVRSVPGEKLKQTTEIKQLTQTDAAITDSYNAAGYWDSLSIRGSTLDSRNGYLRDGLPFFAETWIPLDNKSEIKIFKGLSALQAGVGPPAGVIQILTKQPERTSGKKTSFTRTRLALSSVEQAAYEPSIVLDHNHGEGAVGVRANISATQLNERANNTEGHQIMGALALDHVSGSGMHFFSEIELSKRTQPSRAAFSLHGEKLPEVPDPQINYNSQKWSQPVVFGGQVASIGAEWTSSPHVEAQVRMLEQKVTSDDRVAYGAGCAGEGRTDRYCQDGSFDLYDYRSENELRTNRAFLFSLSGKKQRGPIGHEWTATLLGQHLTENVQPKIDGFVGVQNSEGSNQLPESSDPQSPGTNRSSRKWDITLSDRLIFEDWSLWLGIRHSSLRRESVRTDGSRPTDYEQSVLLPWVALSRNQKFGVTYLSYGEGLDSFVTPNKPAYANPGQPLRDAKSQQWEAGIKSEDLNWSVAVFETRQSAVTDRSPEYRVDGTLVFQGLEGSWRRQVGSWEHSGSALWLQAERQGSLLRPDWNSKKITNVPEGSVRLGLAYRHNSGFRSEGFAIAEGERAITPNGSQDLPAWGRIDTLFSWTQKSENGPLEWQIKIENLLDHRYWQEAPTRYEHLYLYPGRERRWLVGVTMFL
ncbi:MAG: TonB-dependent siderophore receptor [Bdellovibrio sp.]